MNKDFLKAFLKTYRPSGYEKDGAEMFVEKMRELPGVRMNFIDRMWNGCVSIGSERPDALRVLVSGHSDQNCLIVTKITKNGFLKFTTIGGVSPKSIIDTDMHIIVNTNDGQKMIPCFCSYKAIHLEKADDRKKCPEVKDLHIDLGCSNEEQVRALGVRPGNIVVFDNSRLKIGFGCKKDLIVGSGLDDGIACCAVYDIISGLSSIENTLIGMNVRVYGAVISSEETGLRGVGPVVRKIQPDISIDIDVCHDSSTEIGNDPNSDFHIGSGVAITYGPDKYRPLNDKLVRIAEDNEIPIQIGAGKAGCTNTDRIQTLSDNCATALLSIPCRYMHSTIHEMVNINDIDSCIKLVSSFILEIDVNDWK